MTINYWLYADPNDGKTSEIINIIKEQFAPKPIREQKLEPSEPNNQSFTCSR